MFDIGFLELAIIAVVGLIVIGPERLPEVARTVGTWVGRFRRFVSSVKSDIDRELRQEELRKALERDAGLDELKQIMNTDTFTLEEEEKPANKVKAISDEEMKQREAAHSETTEAELEGDKLIDNDTGHTDFAELEADDKVSQDDKTR
jgi:sec-independent protein translocase protein TatB